MIDQYCFIKIKNICAFTLQASEIHTKRFTLKEFLLVPMCGRKCQ